MTNTERIQANNAELREAIEMAESLPDAADTGNDEQWFEDGKTRIWITLSEGRTSPKLGVCPKGTVTVDWGDGTEPDILTGTSVFDIKWTPTHNYASPGDYVITLTVDGVAYLQGSTSTNCGSALLRYSENADKRNAVYTGSIRKVVIGENITTLYTASFHNCYSLKSVTLSEGVTQISTNAFYGCYSLTRVTIPDSVGTSLGTAAFGYCYSLASIDIPNGMKAIGNYAFERCYSLASVTIPSSVSSINSGAFSNCTGVRYYDFTSCTSVPRLVETTAFTGIADDCEMLIPASLYEEWSTETNWVTYASHMVVR